jgi:hypothetical protein
MSLDSAEDGAIGTVNGAMRDTGRDGLEARRTSTILKLDLTPFWFS